MISRRDAAQRLDIPVEMAQRHGLPPKLTEAELAEIEENPPAWTSCLRHRRVGSARPFVLYAPAIAAAPNTNGSTEARRRSVEPSSPPATNPTEN